MISETESGKTFSVTTDNFKEYSKATVAANIPTEGNILFQN